jgi:hypothetical protein
VRLTRIDGQAKKPIIIKAGAITTVVSWHEIWHDTNSNKA